MIELLKVQVPQYLTELDQSIRTRDLELLIRAAHTLAGSAFHFGAESVVQAAIKLEEMGHAGTFEGAEPALATLKREVDLMLAGLANGLR